MANASEEAERNIVDVATLVSRNRRKLLAEARATPSSYRLFEMLPMMPRFTVERVRQELDTSIPTANAAVKVLKDLDIVSELTGKKTRRTYSYQTYIDLLAG